MGVFHLGLKTDYFLVVESLDTTDKKVEEVVYFFGEFLHKITELSRVLAFLKIRLDFFGELLKFFPYKVIILLEHLQ